MTTDCFICGGPCKEVSSLRGNAPRVTLRSAMKGYVTAAVVGAVAGAAIGRFLFWAITTIN
jgi:hypothetical protein